MKNGNIQFSNNNALYDLDVESTILGNIINDGSILRLVISELKNEEIFYKDEHKNVFCAIKKLFDEGKGVDLLSVNRQCATMGFKAITPSYLMEMTNCYHYIDEGKITQHVLMIKELWVRRVMAIQGVFLNRSACDLTIDIFDTLNKSQNMIHKIHDFSSTKKSSTIQSVFTKMMSPETNDSYIPSQFKDVDKVLGGGFWNSTFTIIAGRPGMGKTAIVLQIANNVSMNNIPVVIFSLEMSELQLGYRILSMHTGIPVDRHKRKHYYDHEYDILQQASIPISEMKLHIDDDANSTINSIRAKAIMMKAKYGIGLIIIDYLQLLESADSNKNREQEISSISRGCKKLCKELDIPVIGLSQLSRKVEDRSDKRPQLNDLRESGSLEQDADNVLFLLRPEYYGIEEDPTYHETGGSTKGILELIVAKNREGKVGRTLLNCNMGSNLVWDLNSQHSIGTSKFNEVLPPKNDPFLTVSTTEFI